jgi:integrase
LFTREDGAAIRPGYASRRFVALTAKADLPTIRMHDLRHTSATIGLDAGVPTKVMSVRLGHSTTKITADIYQHVHDASARDAADRIASAIRTLRRTEA